MSRLPGSTRLGFSKQAVMIRRLWCLSTVETVLRQVAQQYSPRPVLRSLTSWVGGGSPRYWLSSNPQANQSNYAHVLIQVEDKADTERLIPAWQKALDQQDPILKNYAPELSRRALSWQELTSAKASSTTVARPKDGGPPSTVVLPLASRISGMGQQLLRTSSLRLDMGGPGS